MVLARAILRKSTDKRKDGHVSAGLGGKKGAPRKPVSCAHSFLQERLAEPLLGAQCLTRLGQGMSLVGDLCSYNSQEGLSQKG